MEERQIIEISTMVVPDVPVGSAVKEADSVEKADSGMDEDSQHSSVHNKQVQDGSSEDEDVAALRFEDSDDSDEDIPVQPKKRMTRILDEDDEDSLPGSVPEEEPRKDVKKTTEEVLDAVLNDSDNDSSEESGDERETIGAIIQKKKKKKMEILDESSNNSSVSGKGTSSQATSTEYKRPDFGNTDLFDAESDSDNGSERAQSSHDEAEDEGFDETAIDPKLLKKLKKGAARKEKVLSKRKAKEEAMVNIHSETQRMVREARVSIPYHTPVPRSLQDFLGRAQQKQQRYRAMKGVRHSEKAKMCEEVLSQTKFPSPKPPGVDQQMKVDNTTKAQTVTALVRPQESTPSVPTTEETQKYDDSDDDSLPDLNLRLDNSDGDQKDVTSADDGKVEGHEGDLDIRGSDVQTDVGHSPSEDRSRTEPDDMDFDDLPDLVVEDVRNGGNETEKLDMETSFELQGSTTASHLPGGTRTDSVVCPENLTETRTTSNTSVGKDIVTATETDLGTDALRSTETAEHQTSTSSDKTDSAICERRDVDMSDNSCADKRDLKSSHTRLSLLASQVELPRLSGGPDSFISLDADADTDSTPRSTGVMKFMDRFLKHTQKKAKKVTKDVDISVVQKEKTAPDREELRESSFTYHTTPIDENPLLKLDTPGAKLVALKSQLSVGMAQRREEARQMRQQTYDLDNEAGFERDDGEEAILDDDAEMSERSDTDVEDDDFEEQFGDADDEGEEEKEKNPFMDEEAEEDGDEDGLNLKLQFSDDEDEKEEEEEEKEEMVVKITSAKKKCRVLQISDDEDSKDVPRSVDGGQTSDGVDGGQSLNSVDKAELSNCMNGDQSSTDNKACDSETVLPSSFVLPQNAEEPEFSPFSKHLSSMATTSPTQRKRVNLPPPIEDSQDLYSHTEAPPPTRTQNQAPFFYLEDSHSQMLDADGFLKVGSTGKKDVRAFGNTDTAQSSDMDELLGLCSGRFGVTQAEEKKTSCKSLFGTQPTQANMDELLGLCSGRFLHSAKTPQESQKSGMKRKLPLDEEEEGEEFRIASDTEENFDLSDKEVLSDDEDRLGDDDTDDVSGDDNDEVDGGLPNKPFTGFTAGNKHGLIRKDFVDEEAELSGSEYDSDENLDIAEEDDFMEIEEGDKDVTIPEEELRNQVGRAHMKQLIDEDKRNLMRLQEMYLPDGDLHSEGGGRTRQFKWRNIDDGTQQDMFGSESEGEKEEEEGENELKWRKERFEREKWLKDQMEQGKDAEDSQFLKFGKVFLKRRDSDSNNTSTSIQKAATDVDTTSKDTPTLKKDTPTLGMYKLSGQKRGSFLQRDKESLAKIAEFNKSSTSVNATGPRNSRSLTFQVISPDKGKEKKMETKVSTAKPTIGPKLRKAHTANATSKLPAAKKPRLEKKESSFSQNSIFNLI